MVVALWAPCHPTCPLGGAQGELVLGCLRLHAPFGGRRELALLLRWVLREAARLRNAGVAGLKANHGANGTQTAAKIPMRTPA